MHIYIYFRLKVFTKVHLLWLFLDLIYSILTILIVLEKWLYSKGAWYFYMLHYLLVTRLKMQIIQRSFNNWLKPQWTQRIFCLPINWNKVSPYYILDTNPGVDGEGCSTEFYMERLCKAQPLTLLNTILTEKVQLHAFVYLLLKNGYIVPLSYFFITGIILLWTKWEKRNHHFHVVMQPWDLSVWNVSCKGLVK